jgi:hypothetical protein
VWRVARAKGGTQIDGRRRAMAPLYCCVTGRGAAVGKIFVEAGIAVTGSGDAAVTESGELLVGDGAVAESGVLLVGVGAAVCGVGWVVVSWFVDGALVVSVCWLHPYSNKPTSVLAAAIWIFCNDFIVRDAFVFASVCQ